MLNNEPGLPTNPAVAPPIRWTTKEVMACAYCWAEFVHPERHMPEDTPETYWLRISERARNECREIAKARLLVAVATGQAPALPHPANISDEQIAAFGAAARLKQRHRIDRIIMALRAALHVPQPERVNDRTAPNTDDPNNNVAATPAGKGETG